MSVVIIGGYDRMVCQYKLICKRLIVRKKFYTDVCNLRYTNWGSGTDRTVHKYGFP